MLNGVKVILEPARLQAFKPGTTHVTSCGIPSNIRRFVFDVAAFELVLPFREKKNSQLRSSSKHAALWY